MSTCMFHRFPEHRGILLIIENKQRRFAEVTHWRYKKTNRSLLCIGGLFEIFLRFSSSPFSLSLSLSFSLPLSHIA